MSEDSSVFKDGETEEKEVVLGTVARALRVISETKRASLSHFQRTLDITTDQATELMEYLEKEDVIGPPDGKKPREILLDLDEPLPVLEEPASLQKKPVVTKNRKKAVSCPLTDAEIADAAQELVKARDEIAEKKKELADFKAEHKEEVSLIEARESQFAGMVRDKVAIRDLECEEVYDYQKEQYTATRKDTGEVVEDRAMTPAELSELPMDE